MKKYLVGTVGSSGKLYFVPEGGRYDGIYISGQDVTPVPIFSFIQRRVDVSPIMDTQRQKQFWKLKFKDPNWAKKHFVELQKPSEDKNPYNKKVSDIYDAIEETQASLRASKYNKS